MSKAAPAVAFSSVLVANRGEIACRIMQTARTLGYRCIAVYSEADAEARHVAMADTALCIGPAPVADSYLSIDNILKAAQLSGAEAVHPGYGFLSENPEFAKACEKAGLVFIGPSAQAIHAMANKAEAKRIALKAKVPCIPGYQGKAQDDTSLIKAATDTGYPLMIKAAAGGGGRGMRLVHTPDNLADELERARSESLNAFGSDELILERALLRPRHIEIQILADTHGGCIHLGERDCSVQRRHQKVIEESPSPVVDEELRNAMGSSAVAAAQAIGYVGAGTVEYLLDADGSFYFLEMNTRLQVEHPVTELVTNTDLVAWQFAIAAGKRVPDQQDIVQRGAAIEVRLYAEDPVRNFLPQTGKVLHWEAPESVRCDHGLVAGVDVSSWYDPMLAKVIAHGDNRKEACRKLASALRDTLLLGVPTNQNFLIKMLEHPAFIAGDDVTTAFIEEHFAEAAERGPVSTEAQAALAAVLLYRRDAQDFPALWREWRSTGHTDTPIVLGQRKQVWDMVVKHLGDGAYTVAENDTGDNSDKQDDAPTWEFKVLHSDERGYVHCELQDGSVVRTYCAWNAEQLYLNIDGDNYAFEDRTFAPPAPTVEGSDGLLRAPMNGRVIAVNAKKGDAIKAGDALVVVEAMKMEHSVSSPVNGVIEEIGAAEGDQVANRQVLVRIAVKS